jgi:hypothetical protein
MEVLDGPDLGVWLFEHPRELDTGRGPSDDLDASGGVEDEALNHLLFVVFANLGQHIGRGTATLNDRTSRPPCPPSPLLLRVGSSAHLDRGLGRWDWCGWTHDDTVPSSTGRSSYLWCQSVCLIIQ